MKLWRRAERSNESDGGPQSAAERMIFASPEWISAVNDHAARGGLRSPKRISAVLNIAFTERPEGVPDVVRIEMRKGRVSFASGRDPDGLAVVYTPYELFREQILSGDYGAAHAAYLDGRIRVEGDLGDLSSLGQMSRTSEFQTQLEEITK